MNIEKIISDEVGSINECIQAAVAQYDTENKDANVIPPDYHVLFMLVRSVVINGKTYTVSSGSVEEKIFYEAVENFKYSVENFTFKNVHIIPTIKIIDDDVTTESSDRNYLLYEDVYEYLKEYSSVGLYDAVLLATHECSMGGAVTALGTFQFENIMHGFTHIEIASSDASRIGHEYSMEYPHLVTTNYFIHEWLHQLGGYRSTLAEIFPDADHYVNPEEHGYTWDTTYFDDTSKYEHVVESYLTSYYRAVLSAEVTYTNGSNSRAIGMFPLFWKVTPRKLVIGRYHIQKPSGEYYYNDNGTCKSDSSLTNDMKYVWNIYYSFHSQDIKIKSFYNNQGVSIGKSYTDLNCTRIGPYDEGDYYLINVTLDERVLGYTSAASLKLLSYRDTTTQLFRLQYNSELYFSMRANTLENEYLDLKNNSDIEDNSVALFGWSGYPEAQTWQYRFIENQYKIFPLRSVSRSLSFHDATLHVVSSSNIQNWRPECISNGKYIIPGSYKIRSSTGKYLTYSGNTLKLASTGKIWNIKELENNYYSISNSSSTTTYYFDVLNAYDIEGNVVQVQYATGYSDAQSWKLMLKNDGSFLLVPRLSLTRGIKATTTGSTLSTNTTSFYLVKV